MDANTITAKRNIESEWSPGRLIRRFHHHPGASAKLKSCMELVSLPEIAPSLAEFGKTGPCVPSPVQGSLRAILTCPSRIAFLIALRLSTERTDFVMFNKWSRVNPRSGGTTRGRHIRQTFPATDRFGYCLR